MAQGDGAAAAPTPTDDPPAPMGMDNSHYLHFPKNHAPPPDPRPPLWERPGKHSTSAPNVGWMKEKQLETLGRFQRLERAGQISRVHSDHFDWWMWPIEDGSKKQFNVVTQEHVDTLKADPVWRANYLEAARICAAAWGWDLTKGRLIRDRQRGQRWDGVDVRLAKMIRSLWLFEEREAFLSLQKFAYSVLWHEKEGRSFRYGGIVLDELLTMTLPRR